jgi:peptidoglycan/LPS O-acetylase OafA/YrhL
MGERRIYIPTLDGWRAIAILMVVADHWSETFLNGRSHWEHRLAEVLARGHYGVDIFFALSGYLICTLLLKEKEATGEISLRSFYVRRIFRILPIIVTYLLAIYLLSLTGLLPSIPGKDFIAVLGFVRNYTTGSWYTSHFWSLAVEEHFYLLMPVLLLVLRRRSAALICVGLVLATYVIRSIEFQIVADPETAIYFRTENRLDGLMMGALLAIYLQCAAQRDWLKTRLSGKTFITAAALGIASTVLLPWIPIRKDILSAVLPFLIAHTVLKPEMFLARCLEWGWVRWIGKLSYSIYVWQMLFLAPEPRRFGWVQSTPFVFATILLCAAASYYFIEKPMIRLGHRLVAKWTLNKREVEVLS